MTIASAYASNLYAPSQPLVQLPGYMSEAEVRNMVGAQVQAATEHLRAPQHQNYIRGLFGGNQGIADQAQLIANGYMPQPAQEQRQLGETFGQMIRALAFGKGNLTEARSWAQRQYPHDFALQRALSYSESVGGGIFVEEQVHAEVTQLLRAATVMRAFNPMILDMPTGTLSIQKVTQGTVATYLGENQDDVATDMEFGDIVLTWKKLRSESVISNDLLRYSSRSADIMVRNDMVANLSTAQDQAFIRGDGTIFTPKGLRHWVLPINVFPASVLPGTVDGNIAAIVNDLNTLWLALLNANVPMANPGFLMAPRTATFLRTFRSTLGALVWGDEMNARGTILGMPFKTTTSVPINLGVNGSEVYLVDFADAVIGDSMNLEIAVSNEATYIQGGESRSAFSRDQTVIRAIQEHDFGLRRAESAAVLDQVLWGTV